MKRYCVDASVLFSALISRDEKHLRILSDNKFYVPDFALLEIDKHREAILKKTNAKKSDLEEYVLNLFSMLTVVPRFAIDEDAIKAAYDICKDADENDTMYVAVAMQLGIEFATRDKRIYEHLKSKGFDRVKLWNQLYDE